MATFRPRGVCDGADDCRRVVRSQVKLGADFIKVNVTGPLWQILANSARRDLQTNSGAQPGLEMQFTNEELTAIVDTAHGLGRPVAAHAHTAAGINAAPRVMTKPVVYS